MRVPLFAASVALSLATPLAAASATAYTFTELTVPSLSAAVFEANGINNAGQVVGQFGAGGTSVNQGFVLDLATGTATTLSNPPGTSALLPTKINDAGQIVGSTLVGSGVYATLGTTLLLDTKTGALTYPFPNYPAGLRFVANNNTGQIAGNFYSSGSRGALRFLQGYLLDTMTGTSIVVADPLAPQYTGPTGLNDHGQVVGFYEIAAVDSGFLFDVATGIYTTLTVPLSVVTLPESINNNGQVVGYSYDASTSFSGFVLDLATNIYTTLNYPGSVFTVADGINDAGQIVGYYSNTGSTAYHAFLATPVSAASSVPEPGSLAILGGSILIFGWASLRRRGVRVASPVVLGSLI